MPTTTEQYFKFYASIEFTRYMWHKRRKSCC